MKKSVILILLFTGMFSSGLFATTFVIDGCTRPMGYSYVRVHHNYIECLGVGRHLCGGSDFSIESVAHRTYSSGDILDFVFNQVENGRQDGNVLFENDLPVYWNVQNGNMVTIEIKDSKTMGLFDIELKE